MRPTLQEMQYVLGRGAGQGLFNDLEACDTIVTPVIQVGPWCVFQSKWGYFARRVDSENPEVEVVGKRVQVLRRKLLPQILKKLGEK